MRIVLVAFLPYMIPISFFVVALMNPVLFYPESLTSEQHMWLRIITGTLHCIATGLNITVFLISIIKILKRKIQCRYILSLVISIPFLVLNFFVQFA